jgi:hypothetical protein
MNNLIIAALTFVMLPAFGNNASAKNLKNSKEAKTEIVVEKMNFTNDLINDNFSTEEYTSVNVDYIIEENGKAYITYINAEKEQAKNDVVKFIESATYNYNLVPGKVYSMKLTLNK